MNILFILCPEKRSKMIVKLTLCLSCLVLSEALPRCLTGYMTDTQSWVGIYGELTLRNDRGSTLDLSSVGSGNIQSVVKNELKAFRVVGDKRVAILGLSSNKLKRVPKVFRYTDVDGFSLAETVQYITFYGNKFSTYSSSRPNQQSRVETDVSSNMRKGWTHGFDGIVFQKLLELDLRSCSIDTVSSRTFIGMPTLQSLYLGENQITLIDADAFAGMLGLVHLDISRMLSDLVFASEDVFEELVNLESLDLSFTPIHPRQFRVLKGLGRKMQKLSICKTGFSYLDDYFFNETSLRYLDLSWNMNIFKNLSLLGGLEDTLKVVYADRSGLEDLEPFRGLRNLEILKVANNHISIVDPPCLQNLKKLQILDLQNNHLSTWYEKTFAQMQDLKYLALEMNDFDVISRNMIEDISHVLHVSFANNIVKCDCNTRNFIRLAGANEKRGKIKLLEDLEQNTSLNNRTDYHIGYLNYNQNIIARNVVRIDCVREGTCTEIPDEFNSNFTLVDYDVDNYQCFVTTDGICVAYDTEDICIWQRDMSFDYPFRKKMKTLIVLIALPILFIIGAGIMFYFRNRLRYFYISLKNSMVLSGLDKKRLIDEGTIFNYDLFVSYCNEDRGWVLEDFISHLEKDCNIRVCLHERDFQVGLSILENIVSCMDRSRTILLIISKKFLLSQWCQFEMHLAQHRLLETRREDLILLLLEEIPRNIRPNTLHYLMLTKTYILWPKERSEQPVFWKRLKRNILTQKLKHSESSVSLA